jgi:hypothetical protein
MNERAGGEVLADLNRSDRHNANGGAERGIQEVPAQTPMLRHAAKRWQRPGSAHMSRKLIQSIHWFPGPISSRLCKHEQASISQRKSNQSYRKCQREGQSHHLDEVEEDWRGRALLVGLRQPVQHQHI